MADVTANTAAMIDHLVLRYKQNTAQARAKMLDLLQACEDAIWAQQDWWFKQEQTTLTTASGTAVYSVNGPVNNVIEIALDNGMPLEFIEPDTYARMFKPYGVITGTPKVWTILPPDTADTIRVHLYPTPDSADALQVIRERRCNVLADSSGSESALPAQHRMVLVEAALQRMQRMEGQIEASQEQEFSHGPRMAAMMAEDQRQTKVRR